MPTTPSCRIFNHAHTREVKRPTLNIQKIERNVHLPPDVFKHHFNVSSLPSNLVFDFYTFSDGNRVSTPESILLNSVLHFRSRGSWQGASAVGTHVMGGLGKTTALKSMCSAKSVQGQFMDGICFIQSSQYAILHKVREEMCRCVRKFRVKGVKGMKY